MFERLPDEIKERTVIAQLRSKAVSFPEKTALIASCGYGGQKRYNFGELDRLSNKLANGLRELGVKKGHRVAILLNNTAAAQAILTFYAVHKLGAVNVPANTRFVGRELEYIFNHSEAGLLVLGAEFLPLVRQIKDSLHYVKKFIVVGSSGDPLPGSDFLQVLEAGPENDPAVEIKEEDDADLIYTSGTTGKPKGVVHTHGSTVATGIAVGNALDLRSGDTHQTGVPFFTSSGCHFNLMASLVNGCTFILENGFEADRTLGTIQQERTTVFGAVPAVYTYILDSGRVKDYDLSSIRVLNYGGAPMPREVIRQLQQVFPGADMRQTYGLTESGPTGTYLPGELALSKIGSVGHESGMPPFTKIRVVDENGKDVPPGVIGEICYRSPAVMRCYFKDPEGTAVALREGWLHSGDLVMKDREGFIYHIDRKKDIVIRGGYNISSIEVENVLHEHRAVLEAAVVAKPHKNLGEDVKAYVVLKKGMEVTTEELYSFCRERLADYKAPRDIELISRLPRNPLGKVLKTELRERTRG